MSGTEALLLVLVSGGAGLINAVAGGGTLLTFPALVLLGVPQIVANATSTLALVIGTGGSIFGFRRQVATLGPWLTRFVPVSLLGGWLGSFLLTHTHEDTFAHIVPFLILFATVLFLAQGALRRFSGRTHGVRDPRRKTLWIAIGFQFLVSVYGGFFGAGIGILMLASLGFLGFDDIHQMNALKSVLGSLINIVASLWFVWSGLIDWPKMAVMTLGALIGYFVGAHYSQRIPQARMRQLITLIGLLISCRMFYRQFLS